MDELTAERYPEFTNRRLDGHAARMRNPGALDPSTQQQQARQRVLLDVDQADLGEEVSGDPQR